MNKTARKIVLVLFPLLVIIISFLLFFLYSQRNISFNKINQNSKVKDSVFNKINNKESSNSTEYRNPDDMTAAFRIDGLSSQPEFKRDRSSWVSLLDINDYLFEVECDETFTNCTLVYVNPKNINSSEEKITNVDLNSYCKIHSTNIIDSGHIYAFADSKKLPDFPNKKITLIASYRNLYSVEMGKVDPDWCIFYLE